MGTPTKHATTIMPVLETAFFPEPPAPDPSSASTHTEMPARTQKPSKHTETKKLQKKP